MPNALNSGGMFQSYYAGKDDAAASQQQNALAGMRQTQFDQGQQDRQRSMMREEVMGATAAIVMAKPEERPALYGQIVPQLKSKYQELAGIPDQYDEQAIIRFLPQAFGPEAAQKIVAGHFAPEVPDKLPIEEVGVGNGMFQKAQVMPNGQLRPIGKPYQKAADASVGLRRETAEQKAQLEAEKRAAAQQATIDKYDYTINLIDGLERHPGLSTAVGAKGLTGGLMFGQVVPGTDAADFVSRLDQLGGRQFLQAFESLKGGGQITQVEGEKATNAIARMQRSQSEKEFRAALAEFRGVLELGLSRLRAGGAATPPEQPAAPTQQPTAPKRRYNPATGKIE